MRGGAPQFKMGKADFTIAECRILATAFSRKSFLDVLDFNDFSHFDYLSSRFEIECNSYLDLLRNIYSKLKKFYRCEYVYKTELIKKLLTENSAKDTVCVSEFGVGSSKADIVMFNGESKAFEIKTEFDSPQRLDKQLDDYKKVFDKCFVVIPEKKYSEYLQFLDEEVGIFVLTENKGIIHIEKERDAKPGDSIDPDAMIGCMRTKEYTFLAHSLGASTEDVPGYYLYTHCKNIMRSAEKKDLKTNFLKAVKSDRDNSIRLKKHPHFIRQMILSLRLSLKKEESILTKLQSSIN